MHKRLEFFVLFGYTFEHLLNLNKYTEYVGVAQLVSSATLIKLRSEVRALPSTQLKAPAREFSCVGGVSRGTAYARARKGCLLFRRNSDNLY